MTERKQSLGQRWESFRPTKGALFWSCAGCVVASMILGFTWGGWTTGSTATKMADDAARSSRNELATAVCVERFQAASDAPAQLEALKALKAWDRRTFIEKGGWAVMPAGAERTDGAVRQCADKIAELPTISAAASP